MASISISDGQLYYAARGESGAPLLFLHGAGDSHLLWNGQLGAFAHSACVMAPDLPGHGRSTAPARKTISAYADSVREFLQKRPNRRVIAVTRNENIDGWNLPGIALVDGSYRTMRKALEQAWTDVSKGAVT